MAFINRKRNQIECKIVYFGAARSGKTTNLKYISKAFKKYKAGEMVSIDTRTDRTIFFDFLPMNFGKIKGCDLRVKLYTVPGQIEFDSTRRLILKEVDGIVFVADSLQVRREENITSLKLLQNNLAGSGIKISSMPMIFQYNKRDLGSKGIPVMPLEKMEKDLNARLKVPAFPASAINGHGVGETLNKCLKMTWQSVRGQIEFLKVKKETDFVPQQEEAMGDKQTVKRALVVDNDFFFVEFLSEIIEKRGYEVVKAYDGKEGITRFEEHPVDMVFVDMVMPKIDGIQFIEYIRKKHPETNLPIIPVAGSVVEQLQELQRLGVSYYIAKGPADKMSQELNRFFDKMDSPPVSEAEEDRLLEPEKVYPRQITMELMDSLNFERAITESLGLGIIVVDKDVKVLRSNALALGILGRSFEDILNSDVLTLFKGTNREKLRDAIKNTASDPESEREVFFAEIRSQQVRIIVSTYTIEDKIAGWIVALEKVEQEERGQVQQRISDAGP